ncbi:MAG: hypothetical protein IPH96_04375 [Saprospiraceae bacterium]|nr:hypothetical protein [Saprospiraceae bacterium]
MVEILQSLYLTVLAQIRMVSPSGIHFGIIESCSCFRPIICHSSCSGTSGTYTYSATLKACTVYSFWIGGCNGDVCNYSISVTGGGALNWIH